MEPDDWESGGFGPAGWATAITSATGLPPVMD
jgi:hypothetical protein